MNRGRKPTDVFFGILNICFFAVPIATCVDAADGPGIFGVPHATLDNRAAPPHARHCPLEKPSLVAAIALPHGLFLVSQPTERSAPSICMLMQGLSNKTQTWLLFGPTLVPRVVLLASSTSRERQFVAIPTPTIRVFAAHVDYCTSF